MANKNLYVTQILTTLYDHCKNQPPFNLEDCNEHDQSFISALEKLSKKEAIDESIYEQGQRLIERIIANYPMITPVLNRDILWILGGSCLHYLGDEEIEQYQQLDEIIYQAEINNEIVCFQQAKRLAFKLH
jgi:hypothetical protein